MGRFVLIVIVAVVGYYVVTAGLGESNKQRQQRASAEKVADDREVRLKEWSEGKASIISAIELAVQNGRPKDAQAQLNRYGDVASGDLDPYYRRVEIATVIESLKAIPRDNPVAREGALNALVSLDPDNQRWKRELVEAKRAADTFRRKEVEDAKRRERAELAQRRREGVSIGMTQERVLQSSWGHPERVNRTQYSFGTREQWVYGSGSYLYFENGVLTSISTSR